MLQDANGVEHMGWFPESSARIDDQRDVDHRGDGANGFGEILQAERRFHLADGNAERAALQADALNPRDSAIRAEIGS